MPNVHRTALTEHGRKVGRKMLGRVSGAAIKIDDDAEVTMGLAVGEGIETALAARQLGLRPVWALGSVGAIRSFPVLPGIGSLTILTESDLTGWLRTGLIERISQDRGSWRWSEDRGRVRSRWC